MKKNQLDYDILLNKICVSRETCDLLRVYYDMLINWNKKINLVSRKSINTSWNRHFLDSAQLWLYLPKEANKWLDFGSGAGFPGLVIAFISKELKPDLKIVLVEKNKKKALFLSKVVNEIGLNVEIFSSNVESIKPQKADVITSRAFGKLDHLLKISYKHQNKDTTSLFPKGRSFTDEIIMSKKNWSYELEKIKNIIDNNSFILKIRKLTCARTKQKT
ncbi:MAG: 16S rRNA (guanine(527)-N(7))-methyltransferase RsmG [Paracoccaceae bacterium]